MKKAILIAIFVYLISSISLLYGYLQTPSGMVFLGGHVSNSGEILNMVLPQLREGHLLIKNLFTSETQPRIFFAPSFLPIAVLGLILPWNSFIFVQIGRLIYTLIFFIIAHEFLKILKLKNSYWTLLMLGFSSGFGFFLNWAIPNSADLWIPEINTFHSILFSPNVIFSQILMMSTLLIFYKGYIFNKKIYVLISALLITILAFEHQFDAVTILLTLSLFLLLSSANVHSLISKILFNFPIYFGPFFIFGLYFFLIKQNLPALTWTSQNHLLSPPLLAYISGFGLVGICAFLAIFKGGVKNLNSSYNLIFCWLLAVMFLIYSPLPFQRRFGEGVHIPLVIFASYYIWELVGRIKRIPIQMCLVILLLFSGVTNIYLLYQDLKAYRFNPEDSPFYLYQEDQTSLEWLRKNSNESDIILADGLYSPLIPGLIGRTVYFGHTVGTALTINPDKKTEEVKNFFFYDTDDARQKFLKVNKITFFFLGKKASDSPDFLLWEKKNYLKKVYESPQTRIFVPI